MFLIIGLGNPGKNYQNTYHNLGFMALDKYAEQKDVILSKKRDNALIFEGQIQNKKVILAKPQTYMNLSGQSVVGLVNRFKIDLKKILVVYDDIDLNFGTIRYRGSGSAGTHNGIKNIVDMLGTTQFPRLRLGAGQPSSNIKDLSDFVLSNIPKALEGELDTFLDEVCSVIDEFILKDGELENKSKQR